jgi:hypothetical protein
MIPRTEHPLSTYNSILKEGSAHLHEFVGALLAQRMGLEEEVKRLMIKNAELTAQIRALEEE